MHPVKYNRILDMTTLKSIVHILVLVTSVILYSSISYAQQSFGIINQLQQSNPDKGNVTISQDPKISDLLNRYYLQNSSTPGMRGFRIRIYFDLGQQARHQSEQVMNEFMENYSGMSIYRTFDSPYYKVSVGDFRTRDEAFKVLKKLAKKYPKAFIVPEWINFPRLD